MNAISFGTRNYPRLGVSLTPLIVLIVLLPGVIIARGAEAVAGIGLLLCSAISLALALAGRTLTRRGLVTGFRRSAGQILPAVPILICIALVATTWMTSGVVPSLICYGLDIISTYPSVVYKLDLTDGSQIEIDNPSRLPDPTDIAAIYEPVIKANILIPAESIGDMLALVSEKRGFCERTDTIDDTRVMLFCTLPLNEILIDFNDRLKSITRGYGSLDYEMAGYQQSKLVKLDILINGEQIDAFASIVHADKAESKGRMLCGKLKDILPRQMFKVAIQAAIGGKIIARETIGSFRKDVTAKCYGGDITRKKKLLEKQKEGKKRMKQIGKVSIPQEAFVKVLKSNA